MLLGSKFLHKTLKAQNQSKNREMRLHQIEKLLKSQENEKATAHRMAENICNI